MNLIILGAGGYGRTVQDIAEQLGYKTTILDDATDFPLDSFVKYISNDFEFIPAFGNNQFRLKWIKIISDAGGKLEKIIHPSSYVSPKAMVKPGTVVLPKAVVNTDIVVE